MVVQDLNLVAKEILPYRTLVKIVAKERVLNNLSDQIFGRSQVPAHLNPELKQTVEFLGVVELLIRSWLSINASFSLLLF